MSPASSHRLCKTQQTWTTLVKSIARSQPFSKSPHRPEKKINARLQLVKDLFKDKNTNLSIVRNLFQRTCERFLSADWASYKTRDRTLHLVGTAWVASFVTGRCGQQENASPRRPGTVCLFGLFCTIVTPWVRLCCPYFPVGRYKRSQVCCYNRPRLAKRWNSIPMNLCSLFHNYAVSPRVNELHRRLRLCQEINICVHNVFVRFLLILYKLYSIPEFKFVSFFSKTGTRWQLNDFTKQNIYHSIAKLFEYDGYCTFADTKCVSNDTVVIFVFIFWC